MFDILRGFVPWMLYFALSDPERASLGAGVALTAVLLLNWKGLRGKKILDWVTLLFFLGLLVALALGDPSRVARYAFAASGLTLSLTALGSVAFGSPFTLQYARESTPVEFHDSPVFLKVNQAISLAWGISFGLQSVLGGLYLEQIGSATLMNEILPNLLTVLAVVFTNRFPDWYVPRLTGGQENSGEPASDSNL